MATIVGSGMMISPFLHSMSVYKPGVIPMSILATMGVFGGMSYYALRSPIGKFNKMGGALYGGLFGLLALNLAGAGSMWMYGANSFSNVIFSVEPYLGIGLFSML